MDSRNDQYGSSDDDDTHLMDEEPGGFMGKELFDNNMQGEISRGNENGDASLPKDADMEQKRRNMEKIEKEFADLKDKFFKDKIAALKREIEAIKNGTHPTFCEKCKELEQTRDDKVSAAEQWRLYQLQNVTNVFDAERRQAEEEYKAEKRQIRERMVQALVDKKKKLTEEKMTMNLTDPSDTRTNTRTLRRRGANLQQPQQNNLKKKLSPPQINYTLLTSEIQEDLNIISNLNKQPPLIQIRR